MLSISGNHFIENRVKPFVKSTANLVYRVVAETTYLFATILFLDLLGKQLLKEEFKSPYQIFRIMVIGPEVKGVALQTPLVEEIIFRGILLRSLYVIQKKWASRKGQAMTEREKKTQMIWRVHLSAFLFAAAHLIYTQNDLKSSLKKFVETYTGGVVYGYLSEKYQTFSLNILAHGCHNLIDVAGDIYSLSPAKRFLAIIVNRAFFYFLSGATTLNEAASHVHQAGAHCSSLSRRLIHQIL